MSKTLSSASRPHPRSLRANVPGAPALVAASLLTLAACDRSGDYLVPKPSDVEPIIDLGQLKVISAEDWADTTTRAQQVTYSAVGAPEPGDKSGVTFTFLGTGEAVCIVMDPEAVFWNQSVAATSPNVTYQYPDNYLDDGDLDMQAGFSANYTGSPGIELGDFRGQYTDSLGNTVEIEYDLCERIGYDNLTPAHAGVARAESCEIDTDGRVGIEYTVLLRTFSLPIDDSILSFATAVYEGSCEGMDECTLTGEGSALEFPYLEAAYCEGNMLQYCVANPEMCGDVDCVEHPDWCQGYFDTSDSGS